MADKHGARTWRWGAGETELLLDNDFSEFLDAFEQEVVPQFWGALEWANRTAIIQRVEAFREEGLLSLSRTPGM